MPKHINGLTALCLAGALAAPAYAQQALQAAGYTITQKSDRVEGLMVVDGYSYAQVMDFIRTDCASGQIGQFALKGKPRTRRGLRLQAFVTTCRGGPHPRFQGTRAVSIEVERTPQGQHLAEYTYGVNGQIRYERDFK